jgi:hypothetical protein
MVELYVQSPIRLLGMVLNKLQGKLLLFFFRTIYHSLGCAISLIRQHSIISSVFESGASSVILHLAHYGEMKLVVIYLFIHIEIIRNEILCK